MSRNSRSLFMEPELIRFGIAPPNILGRNTGLATALSLLAKRYRHKTNPVAGSHRTRHETELTTGANFSCSKYQLLMALEHPASSDLE